ncbi:hypothetical protein [Candidatus Chloroploca asiatica]|uniref:Metal-dependent hydrolase n=1 Tax=Candidatus Chloroploca asiatica TaxID=1506545 RepID=A0A2H3KNS1_9CHLR|nr:hypothetical protein [Candidatus Chloroploca asiatica]PDV99797.1 hypothetical protein A9Q02_00865 [Candidatus Chloroploca asiatica]
MRFRTHLITSLLLGAVCYPRQPVQFASVVVGGTLIDLDHLVIYALRTGDWSIVGALRYDRYRHLPLQPGDHRPRYGFLRSWLHRPLLSLPLCWGLAWRYPALRPVALGVTLHLILDRRWKGSVVH